MIARNQLWFRVFLEATFALVVSSIASLVIAGVLVTGVAVWARETNVTPADRAVLWERDRKEFLHLKLSDAERRRYQSIRQPEGSVVALIFCYLLSVGVSGAASAAWLGYRVRRYVGPISAVAENARRLAGGDLSARAGSATFGFLTVEVAQLVRDFDHLAEQLDRSENTLRQTFASIAHELRTPLQVLRGRLEGLRDEVLARRTRTFMSV